MSLKHPVVAVTGSSGAGTSTVKRAFEHIFFREKINPVILEGDSFHRYERGPMKEAMAVAEKNGNRFFSHFGEDANLFDKLEGLFKSYGATGTGQKRYYLHSQPEADEHNARLKTNKKPGEFTPWEDIATTSDLLFYEGLHGLVKTDISNAAQHVDLGIGVVPIVNLEWIQKIHRDNAERGYSAEVIVDTILRRIQSVYNTRHSDTRRKPDCYSLQKSGQIRHRFSLFTEHDSQLVYVPPQHHCSARRKNGDGDGNHPHTHHSRHD